MLIGTCNAYRTNSFLRSYTLVVEGFASNEGTYTLVTSCAAPPATVPPGASSGPAECGGTYTGDTTGATHVVGSDSGEHYYTVTVSTAQSYTFSTCEGSGYDTRLRLFSGSHLEAASTELANVDDACGLQSRITMTLQPGLYTILVEGYNRNEGMF